MGCDLLKGDGKQAKAERTPDGRRFCWALRVPLLPGLPLRAEPGFPLLPEPGWDTPLLLPCSKQNSLTAIRVVFLGVPRGTRRRRGRAGGIPRRDVLFSRAWFAAACVPPIPLISRGWGVLFVALEPILPTVLDSSSSRPFSPLLPLQSRPLRCGKRLQGQARLSLCSKHRRCHPPSLCQGCGKRSRPPMAHLPLSSPAAGSRQELWGLSFCLLVLAAIPFSPASLPALLEVAFAEHHVAGTVAGRIWA